MIQTKKQMSPRARPSPVSTAVASLSKERSTCFPSCCTNERYCVQTKIISAARIFLKTLTGTIKVRADSGVTKGSLLGFNPP